MKNLLFLVLLCLCLGIAVPVSGQISISGTSPASFYTPVTNLPPCTNSIDVLDASSFAANDHVIIIQMQGATIDETNTASYGNVTAYNGAGLWEKAIIEHISGNTVYFTKDLVNRASYNVTGKIQMVKIYYAAGNITVTSSLRPMDWNGTVGGVLAVETDATLNLSAGIDASGTGFRGGANTQVCPNSCNFSTNENAYFYATGNYRGAIKGEGIANIITGKELGRGAQANGGGGGNDHNNGGAGGGNSVAGGQGGNNAEPGAFNCKGSNNYGVGGKAQTYGVIRMFMGGGGGAGHGNNGTMGGCPGGGNSGFGGNGGGVIILIANSINGGGQTISNNGNNGQLANFDGGGGGGGGGAVFVNTSSFASALTIQARGGVGSSSSAGTGNRCYGPGGGGSGGVVLTNAALPGLVTTSLTGGTAGLVLNSSNACNNTSTTAQAGSAGTVITGYNVIMGTVDPGPACLLPVSYLYFTGKALSNTVRLEWATTREENSARFEIMRSVDGIHFSKLGELPAQGWSSSTVPYTFEDDMPFRGTMYYRLRQVDLNGQSTESPVLHVLFDQPGQILGRVFPNPATDQDVLMLEWLSYDTEPVIVSVLDAMGKVIREESLLRPADGSPGSISLAGLSQGMYFLRVQNQNRQEITRFVVQRKD